MGYIIPEENIEIIYSFVEETTELLEGLEKEILKLESNSSDIGLINNIFRRVHSIKGVSSFFCFVCITRLSHQIEYVLDMVRKEKIEIDSELIDFMLDGIDLLGNFIVTISKLTKETTKDCTRKDYEIVFENEYKVDIIIENIKNNMETKLNINNSKKLNEGELIKASVNETLKSFDKNIEENSDDDIDLKKLDEFKLMFASNFKDQFVLETLDHIVKIEGMLVKLEKNDDDYEVINELFRSIHSIKGNTGIIISTINADDRIYPIVKDISIVTHNYENLLTYFREGKYKFDKNMVNVGYEIVDYLEECIEAISGDSCELISKEAILSKLNSFTNKVFIKSSNEIKVSDIGIKGEVTKDLIQKDKKNEAIAFQSIRVNQEKLDKMMDTIAELITTKNSFMHIAKKLSIEYEIPKLAREVKDIGFSINRISDELQNDIMSIRMIEVKTIFQKLPRIIRDISNNTNKKINLDVEGETTEIDKTIIEKISDPLIHIIRNAADHGIEETTDRIKNGKNETGTIYLRAYNRNKYVFIEIEDDGKGINVDEIKKKAIEKGFISEIEINRMTKKQILNLIFLPGFSTAKKVTEVSGRGVGMDIVNSNINKVNGKINIDSEAGKGTRMTIQLPITLAVSRGLLISVSSESYIIPIEFIQETIKLARCDIHCVDDRYFAQYRGEVLSVEWLGKILYIDNNIPESEEYLNSVIITNGIDKLILIVDKLKNEQEFVIKALSDCLRGIKGFSGSTLLGDGKVALILNPVDLIKMIKKDSKICCTS